MRKIFEKVQMDKVKRSAFDLSHEKKLSCRMGDLIPTYVQEVVPGDHFKGSTEIMMRLAPMVAPVMHRINVFMHYFFVPNRIIWDDWEEFITGGKDGEAAPVLPKIMTTTATRAPGSIFDYMGCPSQFDGNFPVSALPFRAYQQIYNDYYRDQNLIDEIPIDDNSAGSHVILKRAWEKDYFTSALPFSQRGPAVKIPISGEFTPQYTTKSRILNSGTDGPFPVTGDLSTEAGLQNIQVAGSVEDARIENLEEQQTIDNLNATINDLRTSSALQRWLEKQARGGARYIETILHHFNVKSSDARLQRAEYLGGGKQPVVISEVLNTSATTTEPQGNMSGHGVATGNTNQFKYKAEEHGYIIGVMSVLPRTAYQQGFPRHLVNRDDKEEFYWPEFSNLGEQEVKNYEIYAQGNSADYDPFGYQQRYAEMKYASDSVHGAFKTSLDFWHLGRIFATPPALNEDFVNADPDTRIFAVEEGDHLWVQLYNNIKALRPMPYFSNPQLR